MDNECLWGGRPNGFVCFSSKPSTCTKMGVHITYSSKFWHKWSLARDLVNGNVESTHESTFMSVPLWMIMLIQILPAWRVSFRFVFLSSLEVPLGPHGPQFSHFYWDKKRSVSVGPFGIFCKRKMCMANPIGSVCSKYLQIPPSLTIPDKLDYLDSQINLQLR